jgi:6-phosphogluconolactonase (cycloisomerase 2 family)
MSLFRRALASATIALAVPVAIGFAATTAHAEPIAGHVYVLSNQPSGNRVLEFNRSPDGTLTAAGSVDTGGTGTGGGLGSQGAVVLDESGQYLYAVNAGSGTVASFRVLPDGLDRIDVVPSGGAMPTSITVHDNLVYVLNAGGAGSINGFTAPDGHLEALAGSSRPLSGAGTAPAQVSFAPAGDQLVVTERATQHIDVYAVGAGGYATGPTVLPSAGVTPFGFAFDNKDHLIVSEAFGGAVGASAVSSYTVGTGALTTVSASVPTTETAACWIAVTNNGRFAYAGNAGGSVTGYRVGTDGSLTILDADGRTAAPGAGVTDLALSRNSKVLYSRLSNGTVGAWAVQRDGSLDSVGSTPGLPAGAAGIAAS